MAEKPDSRDWLITRKLIGTWKFSSQSEDGMKEVETTASLQATPTEDGDL